MYISFVHMYMYVQRGGQYIVHVCVEKWIICMCVFRDRQCKHACMNGLGELFIHYVWREVESVYMCEEADSVFIYV